MSKVGMPTRHKLMRITKTDSFLTWIRSTCSCGWIGTKHYKSNSQLPDVQSEEAQHLLEAERLINQEQR